MENTVQASVKVTTKDMFFFMLQHTYLSIPGVCSLLFSIASLIGMVRTWGTVEISYTVMLALCGALFTVINPFMLYTRSAKQVLLNPSLKTPIEYEFTPLGFTMRQGEEEAKAQYHNLYKVKNTKNYLYLYGNKTRANIISKKQLGAQAEAVAEMAVKGHCMEK